MVWIHRSEHLHLTVDATTKILSRSFVLSEVAIVVQWIRVIVVRPHALDAGVPTSKARREFVSLPISERPRVRTPWVTAHEHARLETKEQLDQSCMLHVVELAPIPLARVAPILDGIRRICEHDGLFTPRATELSEDLEGIGADDSVPAEFLPRLQPPHLHSVELDDE